VLLVPGTFANTNVSVAEQEPSILAKMEGYLSWAVEDEHVIGFHPWHYANRTMTGPNAIYAVGLQGMPTVEAYVVGIGKLIKNGTLQDWWYHEKGNQA
jgi:hypothetical protein